MKKLVLTYTLISFLSNFAIGQKEVLQFDSININQNLTDLLFVKNDSLFDDIYNKRIAINASCVINSSDTLYACGCIVNGDTVIIDISGRFGEIIINQYIKIYKNKFTTFNKEIEPICLVPYMAYPVKQKLILQMDNYEFGKLINGYIEFEGKGKYTQEQIKCFGSAFGTKDEMTKEQIKQGFTRNIKGFFKCKLESK